MARRKRDYKAEYAAAKRRAQRAGYKSEREYKQTRKTLKLPPRTSPIPKRVIQISGIGTAQYASSHQDSEMSILRRAAQRWSDRHSHSIRSQYRPDMSDEQLRKYHRAYVEPVPTNLSRRKRAIERRRRIKEYLVPDWITESEWESKYLPV